MAVLNANDIQSTINGNAIGFATETSFSFNNSLIEVTTRSTNGWVEKISALRGATISFSGLVTADLSNVNSIGDTLRVGSRVNFRFGSNRVHELMGNGYCSAVELSGGTDDVPNFSGTIEITAEVAIQIISSLQALQINGEDVTVNGDTLLVAVEI